MNKKLLAAKLGDFELFGPLSGKFTKDPLGGFERIISVIIGLMTVVGGIYFIFLIITGAYNWIGAQGDKQKLTKARDTIMHALIGLVIMLGAYVIISVVGYILGFSILNPTVVLIQKIGFIHLFQNWRTMAWKELIC